MPSMVRPVRLLFALLLLLPAVSLLAPAELHAQAASKKAEKKEKKGDAQEEEAEDAEDDSKLKASTLAGLEMRGIGPAFMSGRIADIDIDPTDRSTWYVAVGSGGVWKTTNAGTTWASIFDGQGSYSIGDVTLDPNDPATVWVGTGENVGGRHVGYGDGVYKSTDGGASWNKMGLEESEHIGNIVIDPRDSKRVFVAAQGPLWSGGGERGLYRTDDGGDTWTKVLPTGDDAGPYTGVNEVAMHPENPDVLIASTHQRFRNVAALINGGPGSGIWKSTDGGDTWREITRGLPTADMGKIGLAYSPLDPSVVYATIELGRREGGFWRSTDGGESWAKQSDYVSGGTGPHYYQEIIPSPHRFDRVYQMDAPFMVTEDGGKNFRQLNQDNKHGDNHALAFDPNDPDYLLVGTDGGLYESWDLGETYKFVENLPVTQFYKIALDNDVPFYNIYGGTQDNSTQGGPSQTDNISGIRNRDWFITLFADGHQPAVDPTNPDIVYSEWQQGNPVRYDRATGEAIYIQPQGDLSDPPERFNWDAPILISPHDPARLYYASQRVWRSDDRGDSWRTVSGDLTHGGERLNQPMMDRTWSVDAVWDLFAMSNYGTITSLAESPRVEGLLYVGTDDGRIQVSEDGGGSWREAGPRPGSPDHAFVNDLKADLHDADTVYAALDDHKSGDFAPYLYKSTDRGRTWSSIASDLPERHLVWRVVQDHEMPELLFAATEFGVFFTRDGGGKWIELTGGVPTISFRDLAIQQREDDLVAASFGRGIFILDDYSPLRAVTEEMLEEEAVLFPVDDAHWYIPKRPVGLNAKGSQGDDYFVAPNPPFGAVFTYHLADGYKTRREVRKEREKEATEAGEDILTPPWEDLRAEELEEAPAIVFTVRDAGGDVIRQVTGPVSAGMHRVSWDLRYPDVSAETGEPRGGFFGNQGPMVMPGTYRVEMAKRVGGGLTPLGEPRTFEVVPLPGRAPTLRGLEPTQIAEVTRHVLELRRAASGLSAVLDETEERLDLMRTAVARSAAAGGPLAAEARALDARLSEIRLRLEGNREIGRMGEPTVASPNANLGVYEIGTVWSLYGPTATHRRSIEMAEQQLAQVHGDVVELVERDVPAFAEKLDAAGVPWTPGRGVPALP